MATIEGTQRIILFILSLSARQLVLWSDHSRTEPLPLARSYGLCSVFYFPGSWFEGATGASGTLSLTVPRLHCESWACRVTQLYWSENTAAALWTQVRIVSNMWREPSLATVVKSCTTEIRHGGLCAQAHLSTCRSTWAAAT
jgi:hypothetical protein